MRTALITFRDARSDFRGKLEKRIVSVFNDCGIEINNLFVLPKADDIEFVNLFQMLKDGGYNNVIIMDGLYMEFSVKDALSLALQLPLMRIENVRKAVEEYLKKNEIPPVALTDELSMFFQNSTILPNQKGLIHGFILEYRDMSIIYLPDEPSAEEMIRGGVSVCFEEKYKIKFKKTTLKMFGVNKKDLERFVSEQVNRTKRAVKIVITSEHLDYRVDIIYSSKTAGIIVEDVVQCFLYEFKGSIYAQGNVTLTETLYAVLKESNLKLSTAESFTGGNLAAKIIKIPGASGILLESVVAYDNRSKVSRLNVSPNTLKSCGAVSVETAYEMAAGLLAAGADVTVATTGIAGPGSDGTNKPVGLCFIAVGLRSGIYVYKYNIDGDRDYITKVGVNAAMFNTIMKIRSR